MRTLAAFVVVTLGMALLAKPASAHRANGSHQQQPAVQDQAPAAIELPVGICLYSRDGKRPTAAGENRGDVQDRASGPSEASADAARGKLNDRLPQPAKPPGGNRVCGTNAQPPAQPALG